MKQFILFVTLVVLIMGSVLYAEDIYDDLPMITKEDISRGLISSDLEPSDTLSVDFNLQYKLQKGDRISINVMDHNEFTKSNITILPDGGFEYPLLGNIKVENMRITTLRTLIEEKLLPYVTIPVVTIYVEKIYGHKIHILGYVNSPGEHQIYEPIKLTQALSLARGVKNIREVESIRLIRKDGEVFDININDIWFSNELSSLENQIIIYPGDTLVIPPPKGFPWQIYTAILTTLSFFLSIYNSTK